jgi:hypothetical protein
MKSSVFRDTSYTGLYPRGQNAWKSPLWKPTQLLWIVVNIKSLQIQVKINYIKDILAPSDVAISMNITWPVRALFTNGICTCTTQLSFQNTVENTSHSSHSSHALRALPRAIMLTIWPSENNTQLYSFSLIHNWRTQSVQINFKFNYSESSSFA